MQAAQLRKLVEPMLSFEVSAFDIVLLIAFVVLLLLFIAQRKRQVPTESRVLIRDEDEELEKPGTMGQSISKESSQPRSSTGFQRCIHQFGYLRKLPKNSSVPDECFGCPKVMRCLFPNEQKPQQVH